jgi:hypothetical protein
MEKRKWLQKTLEEADTNDIWAFRKWSKGARKYPTPPISRGPNRTKAIYTEDKANAIHQELFQPPPDLPNTTTPDLNHENPNDLPWHPITREEVRKAIFLPRKSKAPGLSQMNYEILRWAWLANQSLFHSLIDGCARIRYHPKIWRIAIAIALPKPGKADYSEPRAYHLIQLLECIGKVIEKIMADRLTYFLNKHTLTPFSQFGAHKDSSTTDAALTFTHDIQTARNKGLVTSALTLDIKGYFDFVNHKKLLTKMRQAHLPLPMVKWIASFLTEHQAAISLDGQCTKIKLVLNGLP